MRKLDHFWLFSKALALAYLCFGGGVSWNMIQGQHWASALIVIAASVFFAVGHWLRLYWAFQVTMALAAVVNIFSVFYFFPGFGSEVEGVSMGRAIVNFTALTAIVALLGLYFYMNQNKMVKGPASRAVV